MATREENLKKINEQLELMSEEELNQVSGGSCYESADDSRFLNVLLQGTKYHHCDRYGATKMFFGIGISDVFKAWHSLGIEFASYPVRANQYYLNGKEITRDEAWAHAEKLVGKHLTKAQWDW